jgi:Holliday junction resolvase RusA-like endonuclease
MGTEPLFPVAQVQRPVRLVVIGQPTTQGSHVPFVKYVKNASPCRECGQRPVAGASLREELGQDLQAWRNNITTMAARASRLGRLAFHGPLAVSIVVTRAKPAGTKFPDVPWGRPDLDKLIRAIFDGCTVGKLFDDDCQIVWIDYAGKVWPGHPHPDGLRRPGAVIRVRPYENPPAQASLDAAITRLAGLPPGPAADQLADDIRRRLAA